jgi:hypothetical protein
LYVAERDEPHQQGAVSLGGRGKFLVGDRTSQRVHDGGVVGVGVGVDSGEDFLGLLVDHAGAAAFSSR